MTLGAFHPESHSEQGHGSLCDSAWLLWHLLGSQWNRRKPAQEKNHGCRACGTSWHICSTVTGTWALLSGWSPILFFFTKLPELRRTEVYVGKPHTDLSTLARTLELLFECLREIQYNRKLIETLEKKCRLTGCGYLSLWLYLKLGICKRHEVLSPPSTHSGKCASILVLAVSCLAVALVWALDSPLRIHLPVDATGFLHKPAQSA